LASVRWYVYRLQFCRKVMFLRSSTLECLPPRSTRTTSSPVSGTCDLVCAYRCVPRWYLYSQGRVGRGRGRGGAGGAGQESGEYGIGSRSPVKRKGGGRRQWSGGASRGGAGVEASLKRWQCDSEGRPGTRGARPTVWYCCSPRLSSPRQPTTCLPCHNWGWRWQWQARSSVFRGASPPPPPPPPRTATAPSPPAAPQ
jgi:hypothetical protein